MQMALKAYVKKYAKIAKENAFGLQSSKIYCRSFIDFSLFLSLELKRQQKNSFFMLLAMETPSIYDG